MSLELTQSEADALFALAKLCQDRKVYYFTDILSPLRLPLISKDGREEFWLDITSSKIELSKYSYNHRARKSAVLARLDLNGPPHRNPDGQEFPCPHLHLYREGYGDKWAINATEQFSNTDDPWQCILDFMEFCNIIGKPNMQKGLF
jgi:hypothetical protein